MLITETDEIEHQGDSCHAKCNKNLMLSTSTALWEFWFWSGCAMPITRWTASSAWNMLTTNTRHTKRWISFKKTQKQKLKISHSCDICFGWYCLGRFLFSFCCCSFWQYVFVFPVHVQIHFTYFLMFVLLHLSCSVDVVCCLLLL